MIPSQFQPLANHLWQSTLFAGVAGLLTLGLRKNAARTRYWLWLAASVKFLVPFSILVMAGSHFGRPTPAPIAPPITFVIEQISQPFPVSIPAWVVPANQPSSARMIPAVLSTVWAIGFVFVVSSWWRRSRSIRAALGGASPLDLPLGIKAMSSPAIFEPGVFGIRRPVLLLPEGITSHLTTPQLEAILAHELCHVRRRDNLVAVLHMAVEALFWFHPLVWWLGAQLMEERERVCDEEVLRMGNEPGVYAQGILKICELYLESPSQCVAGVTGANLKKRIEAIMSNRIVLSLNFTKKVALAVAGVAALAGPIVVGVINAPAIRAQSRQVAGPSASTATPKFEVASIKQNAGGGPIDMVELNLLRGIAHDSRGGRFRIEFAPLKLLIQLAYNVKDFQVLGAPSWANSDRYEVNAKAEGNATFDQMRPMLQSLLADRFKLTLRRETRELPVYELAAAKGGLKIVAAKEGSCITSDPNRTDLPGSNFCGIMRGINRGTDSIDGFGISMPKLIESLTDIVNRIIIDKTGFTGTFDAHLEFVPDGAITGGVGAVPLGDPGRPVPASNSSGPSIFTALKEQLGLRLESAKGPVEVLVIDHVERPSAN